MVIIRVGAFDIEIDPFVREAVETLGYFRYEAIDDVIDMYERTRRSGLRAIFWERTEEISDDEKAAIGWPIRASMPRRLWDALSDKGRADPARATIATGHRIRFALYRERDRIGDAIMLPLCSRAQLFGVGELTCDQARPFDKMIVASDRRFTLPLETCDREWCACNWVLLPDK